MSEDKHEEEAADQETADIVLDAELDAPPEKVWRAISRPEFREQWLPGRDLRNAEPVSSEAEAEISYRMKDDAPPFLESIVTFRITPHADGRTRLRILHVLADERVTPQPLEAANSNRPLLMRAMLRAA
ncbi:SRPBCC family protein [Denitrobaculum tricleocarpae]|uniref:Polyketide cyclase n=1 Tax=Denitrobaculum tricleocarpae TaxID=2591009 RepID=A0A545SXP4_9PROT|nr:SRPBCC domain-containing protein [Denitrobaculum tricleocarpae]TQV69737.1 polyketide cyclase [Denitrobaculum tricleocarpae]